MPYGNSEEGLRNRVQGIKTIDGLCHLCNGGVPKQEYGNAMYYSSFLQKYLPYHKLLSRQKHGRDSYEKEEAREIENELRERFEYPKIGEKWKAEVELLNIVKSLFPDEKIIHQANFEWLGLQRIDIYIPCFKVGIEYHGLQHYNPVEFFGGTEGFQKTKERDRRKAKLCQDNGVRLIYFSHSDTIDEKNVESRIKRSVEDEKY